MARAPSSTVGCEGNGPMPLPDADTTLVTRAWLDVPFTTMAPASTLHVDVKQVGDGRFPPIVEVYSGTFHMGTSRSSTAIMRSWARGRLRYSRWLIGTCRSASGAPISASVNDDCTVPSHEV